MSSEVPNVPGYKIIKPLGEGGMASVFLAVQESLDREVALKVMAPALAANREFTERFLKEGRITARLSHPNLVTVFDIGQAGTVYYLAAEFIPGGTLHDRAQNGMSVGEILAATCDVALGLHYAHEKGFVHRDVKPGNVLFKNNGTAVLADFGIAKSVDSSTMATQAGSSIGTPHYMSPEQARAEKVDGRSDLYSTGVMLYQLLANRLPYDAPDPFTVALMHITHPIPKLPENLAWLQPLIDGLMAKDPEQRFPTGEAFVESCEKLLGEAPEAAEIRNNNEQRRRLASRLSNTRTDVTASAGGGGSPSGGAATVVGPSSGRGAASTPTAITAAPSRGAADPAAGSAAAVPAKKFPVGIAVAAVLALVAVGGGVMMMGGKKEPPPTVAPVQPVTPVPPPIDEGTLEDVAARPFDNNKVADVVKRAKSFVRLGVGENGRRLASPEGDCAIDLFKHALELDPSNAEASAGLEQVAAYFESKAKAAFDRGFMQGSLVLAEEGLRAQPDREGLKKIAEAAKKATP